LYPPGLEFVAAFFGCLQAGVIAVPTFPPRPERAWQGQQLVAGIVRDCRPAVVLTGGEEAATVQRSCGGVRELDGVRWVNTELIPDRGPVAGAHASRVRCGAAADDVALLQYTSGATGDPKGVMVTHRNLLHNERMMQLAFGHTKCPEYAAGVCWLPPYHDMGLMGHVLHGVYIGFPCMLLPPLAVVQRPLRWLQAISRYRADASGGPNFIYEQCASRITPEERRGIDLSHWNIAGVGAEPVRAATLERFAECFEPCGFRREAFYPCYGLAEATLFVAGGDHGAAPVVREFAVEGRTDFQSVRTQVNAQHEGALHMSAAGGTDTGGLGSPPYVLRLVGCGRAWLDQTIEIVDPGTRVRCPPGRVGETWVSGPSVAAGYWGGPGESEATFRATLAGVDAPVFLRTGDLGFVDGGELFVTGRLKDLIIIRGRNHHPQDIEAAVQSVHSAFRRDCGAAFGADLDGEERLVVVQEIDRRTRALDLDRLTAEVRQAISRQFELRLDDLVFLRNGTLPRTTSGKVQRHACRTAYLRGTLTRWSPK
jgi:acyl-CoA synthetase (AMP-forming)/AMP-acid ligase II